MPEKEPVSSKLPLLLAGNVLVLIGLAVILMLAAFSVSIWYWLFGSGAMMLGLLLRKIADTPPKYLRMSHALLQSLENTLLFLDLVVLLKFVIDWMMTGPTHGFHYETLLWAGGLTLAQVIISKFDERITRRKASPRQ